MFSVILSLSQKPSLTQDRAQSLSNPNPTVDYSNQERRYSFNVDSDQELYQDSQQVRSPIPTNTLPIIHDLDIYQDNLLENPFRHNFITYAEALQQADNEWNDFLKNVLFAKEKKQTSRIFEDAMRNTLQAIQSYSSEFRYMDLDDMHDENEVETFFRCLVKFLNALKRQGGVKTVKYRKLANMLFNKFDPQLNKKHQEEQNPGAKIYLAMCKDCTPTSIKSLDEAKEILRQQVIELMTTKNWILRVILREIKYKKDDQKELAILQRFMWNFARQLKNGGIDLKADGQAILDESSEIEQKNLQKGKNYAFFESQSDRINLKSEIGRAQSRELALQ